MAEYTDFPSWDEMSVRDQLLSSISDVHKEVYGFRTRRDFSGYSDEQLEEFLTNLCADADDHFLEEKLFQEEKLAKFRKTVVEVCEMCNCEPKDALRYLMEAEDVDDIDHFFYRQGLNFTAIANVKAEYEV